MLLVLPSLLKLMVESASDQSEHLGTPLRSNQSSASPQAFALAICMFDLRVTVYNEASDSVPCLLKSPKRQISPPGQGLEHPSVQLHAVVVVLLQKPESVRRTKRYTEVESITIPCGRPVTERVFASSIAARN